MARPGFSLDRKFKRLSRSLEEVFPGLGDVLARGAVELLWDASYEACDEYVGDAVDVEAQAQWRGASGVLVAALVAAGGAGKAGFIEEGGSEWWADGPKGTYRIHDLWDHAPDYAKKRLARELEREQAGTTIREQRAAAGRKGAAKTNGKRAERRPVDAEPPSSGRQAVSKQPPFVEQAATGVQPVAVTPTLAPAPAPALEAAAEARERASASDERPAPRLAPDVEAEDEPRRGGLRIDDLTQLGPLGAELRGRLEQEFDRSLANASPALAEDVRRDLEGMLATREAARPGAVERAAAWLLRQLAAKPAGFQVGSVTLVRDMLRAWADPAEASPAAAPTANDPWGQVLAALRVDGYHSALLEELERLPGALAGDELVLTAPTRHEANRLGDLCTAPLERAASHVLGRPIRVRVVSPEPVPTPQLSLVGGLA